MRPLSTGSSSQAGISPREHPGKGGYGRPAGQPVADDDPVPDLFTHSDSHSAKLTDSIVDLSPAGGVFHPSPGAAPQSVSPTHSRLHYSRDRVIAATQDALVHEPDSTPVVRTIAKAQ